MRYTPAGLPALDFELKHESQLSEDGQPRKVSLQLRAVAIGRIAEPLTALELGSEGHFGGFLAAALGKVPAKGENYAVDGVTFEVTDADERKVKRVRVTAAVAT